MKTIFAFCTILLVIQLKVAVGRSHDASASRSCVNMWDEGCVNGQLIGSGRDDDYVNGGFNPGKRCVNVWDEGCINEQLPGSGRDDDYVNGGFNPGKRCVGEGCNRPNFGGEHNNEIKKRIALILTKLFNSHH